MYSYRRVLCQVPPRSKAPWYLLVHPSYCPSTSTTGMIPLCVFFILETVTICCIGHGRRAVRAVARLTDGLVAFGVLISPHYGFQRKKKRKKKSLLKEGTEIILLFYMYAWKSMSTTFQSLKISDALIQIFAASIDMIAFVHGSDASETNKSSRSPCWVNAATRLQKDFSKLKTMNLNV